MADTTFFAFRRADRDSPREATAPQPRLRGPVLIGDLLMSYGGRPVLLTHWDQDDRDQD